MNPAGRKAGATGLGLANAFALLASVGAAAAYARWLTAESFGHWAAALALARAALLLVDGGLKTALVRREHWPGPAAMAGLRRMAAAAAVLLILAVGAGALWAWHGASIGPADAMLYVAYAAAYLLSHAALFGPLARLERAGRFGVIGRAEAASLVLEFVGPAALMSLGAGTAAAFAASVVAARGLRGVWVVRAARAMVADSAGDPTDTQPERAVELLREGAGVQAVTALSMLRDQMHLWLLAPWFGAAWGGQYGLAMTVCALATQVPVQTAARLSLSALRRTSPRRRWSAVHARVRRLAVAVLPPLPLLPAALAWADDSLWRGHWQAAVLLLPWLALRMVAGVVTTPVGSWLLVARTPWAAAHTHAAWTALEVAAAVLGLALLGPTGLAVAAALAAWPGMVLLLAAAGGHAPWRVRLAPLMATLWLRPSLAVGLLLGAVVRVQPALLPWAVAALPLAWLAEPRLRRRLRAACWGVARAGALAPRGRHA